MLPQPGAPVPGGLPQGCTTLLGTFREKAFTGNPSWGNLNMKSKGLSDAPFGLAWIQHCMARRCLQVSSAMELRRRTRLKKHLEGKELSAAFSWDLAPKGTALHMTISSPKPSTAIQHGVGSHQLRKLAGYWQMLVQ